MPQPRVTPTPDRASGVSRRTVLGGTAALGVGAPLLAACGSDDGGSSDAEAPDAGTVLTPTADVPVGGGVILAKDGAGGDPARGGDVQGVQLQVHPPGVPGDEGVEHHRLPLPQSKFSITDGSPESGPASSPLPETAVKVDGDNITTA